MRSIQTQDHFPLSSVKPLDGVLGYRHRCLEATSAALRGTVRHRERSPIGGTLAPCGDIGGLSYGRCAEGGGLFLMSLPEPAAWARLLADVNRLRHSPETFHANLAHSRTDHVYAPKLEWIRDTLRLQEVVRPRLLEVVTPPSDFTRLLQESGACADVWTADEADLRTGAAQPPGGKPVDAALLLESLDRSDDPAALVTGVARRLSPGGLLFVTALVASGFDMTVLGLRNLYLCPPDRANCFSLTGLNTLLTRGDFELLEVSTPGVLDVEIVRAHAQHDPSLVLSPFERQIVGAEPDTQAAFQSFLQQQGLSSFARIVARKQP